MYFTEYIPVVYLSVIAGVHDKTLITLKVVACLFANNEF